MIHFRPIKSQFKFFKFALAVMAVLVTSSAFAITADLELPPWVWREGSWGISGWGDYSMSSANYGSAPGAFTRLPSSNSFNVVESTYKARFAFHDLVSVYAGAGYNYTTAHDSGLTRNNAQPSVGFAGADFNLPNRWLRLIPEIEAGFPFYHYNTNSSLLSTGDSTTYFRGSLFYFKPVHLGRAVIDILGHASFYAPSDNLAKLAMFEAALEIPIGRSVAIGGGAEGYTTVISDSLTLAQRQSYASVAEAQSLRYDAYNPSLLELKAWLRLLPIPGYNVRVGYSKSINGTNTASVQAITLAIAFNFSSIFKPVGSPRGSSLRSGATPSERLFEENRVRDRSGDQFIPDDHADDPPKLAPAQSDGGLGDTEQLLEQRN